MYVEGEDFYLDIDLRHPTYTNTVVIIIIIIIATIIKSDTTFSQNVYQCHHLCEVLDTLENLCF